MGLSAGAWQDVMLPPWQGEQHWGVLTVPVLTHKGQMSLMATALLSPCDQKGALVPLKTRSKVSYLDSVFFPYVFTKKQRGLVVHCLGRTGSYKKRPVCVAEEGFS